MPAYAQLGGHVPPGSSWGVFRDDPERGTANFAVPAQVLDAVAGVRTGQVFSLDHALDAFDPPMARARRRRSTSCSSSHAESRDDVLREFYLQATSQVDGLRHRRASGYGFYNGVADDEIQAGTPALGVQRWAEKPIVGRGLVVDIEGLLAADGTPSTTAPGPPSTSTCSTGRSARRASRSAPAIFSSCTPAGRGGSSTPTRPGVPRSATGGGRPGSGRAGSFRRGCGTTRSRCSPPTPSPSRSCPSCRTVAYLDTAPEDAGMMHQELIAKLGVPLGELWNLTDLVADSRRTGRWDALVVVKPLHLVGGVGSPPNATAIR